MKQYAFGVDIGGTTIKMGLSCVINPQVFVIGGGMSKARTMLIDAIETHYKGYAFHACRDTSFKLAELSNDAGIFGGVRLILE